MRTPSALALGVFVTLASACREPPLSAPVPELSSPSPARGRAAPAYFPSGENLGWDVYVRGLGVGRFDLSVSDRGPRTLRGRLKQGRLAKTIGHARISLETILGTDHYPDSAAEDVAFVGRRTQSAVRFFGDRVQWQRGSRRGTHSAPAPIHSALSALGALRGHQLPRRLYVATGVSLYELKLSSGAREILDGEPAIRVDAEAREYGRANLEALLSIWIADDAVRTPLRVDVAIGRTRLVGKLVNLEPREID